MEMGISVGKRCVCSLARGRCLCRGWLDNQSHPFVVPMK